MNLEKRIDDLISKMTLEEKIGQLNQISSAGEVGKLKELIKKGKVGSPYNGKHLLCRQRRGRHCGR